MKTIYVSHLKNTTRHTEQDYLRGSPFLDQVQVGDCHDEQLYAAVATPFQCERLSSIHDYLLQHPVEDYDTRQTTMKLRSERGSTYGKYTVSLHRSPYTLHDQLVLPSGSVVVFDTDTEASQRDLRMSHDFDLRIYINQLVRMSTTSPALKR